MFVFNVKVNGNKFAKIFIGVLCVIVLIATSFICYKLIFNSSFKTNDEMRVQEIYEINSR